jgi:hypothetical protein
MVKRCLTLAVLLLAGVSGLEAQSKKLGLGIIVGAPTGFSLKYWTGSGDALQGYVGGGFGGIAIGADYVFHSNAFNDQRIPFYYGPGAFVGPASYGGPRYDKNAGLGLGFRFVFGADYVFPDHPFDIAFEMGPALVLSPVVGVGLEGGIAFRFYP